MRTIVQASAVENLILSLSKDEVFASGIDEDLDRITEP
jgi:hypothetical protein